MMQSLVLCVAALCCLSLAISFDKPPVLPGDDLRPAVTKELVDAVNSGKHGWTASLDGPLSAITVQEAKGLCGVLRGGPKLDRITYQDAEMALPDQFESSEHWPQCVTMKEIRDQSACGSCWAFGAVEAMSDRYCIFKGKTNLSISADDMLACCTSCGMGCQGGYPSAAWRYWVTSGLVNSDCDPYPFPSCDHHIPNSPNPCPSADYNTPPCVKKCKDNQDWQQSLNFGASSYSLAGEQDIMAEIYKNGPVETSFSVYADFLTYKSGVYKHVSGSYLGGHAVKFVGWGVENGVKYWNVANSWNPSWGEKGFFRILRGVDECGIEDSVNAGIPK